MYLCVYIKHVLWLVYTYICVTNGIIGVYWDYRCIYVEFVYIYIYNVYIYIYVYPFSSLETKVVIMGSYK